MAAVYMVNCWQTWRSLWLFMVLQRQSFFCSLKVLFRLQSLSVSAIYNCRGIVLLPLFIWCSAMKSRKAVLKTAASPLRKHHTHNNTYCVRTALCMPALHTSERQDPSDSAVMRTSWPTICCYHEQSPNTMSHQTRAHMHTNCSIQQDEHWVWQRCKEVWI